MKRFLFWAALVGVAVAVVLAVVYLVGLKGSLLGFLGAGAPSDDKPDGACYYHIAGTAKCDHKPEKECAPNPKRKGGDIRVSKPGDKQNSYWAGPYTLCVTGSQLTYDFASADDCDTPAKAKKNVEAAIAKCFAKIKKQIADNVGYTREKICPKEGEVPEIDSVRIPMKGKEVETKLGEKVIDAFVERDSCNVECGAVVRCVKAKKAPEPPMLENSPTVKSPAPVPRN